jgi:acyl carrier protein
MNNFKKFETVVQNEAKDAGVLLDLTDKSLYNQTFTQLGFDSMRVMNLLVDLEDEFDVFIPDEEFLEITIEKYLEKIK